MPEANDTNTEPAVRTQIRVPTQPASDRRIIRLEDWTEAEMEALLTTEMEPGLEHLNAELG